MDCNSLSGTTDLVLDDRGRISVPARYRDELRVKPSAESAAPDPLAAGAQSKVVVTMSPQPSQRCLLIYPLANWQKAVDELTRADTGEDHVQFLLRTFVGRAEKVDLDGNGRVLIARWLRDYADLQKEVTLVGVSNKFELWATALYEEDMKQKRKKYADVKVVFRF